GNLFAVAGRDKRRDAHVDTNNAPRRWQGFRRGNFTSEAGVPFARLQDDAYRLNRAFYRSVPTDRNTPDTVQLQASPVYLRACAVLLEFKAVETVARLEAWVACFLTRLYTAKEGLIGKINLLGDALRGLAEHLLCIRERGAVAFRKLLGF